MDSYFTPQEYGRVYSNLPNIVNVKIVKIFGNVKIYLYLCWVKLIPTEYHVLWIVLVWFMDGNRIYYQKGKTIPHKV